MIHARTAIRQAFVAALAAGGTLAGARVYDTPSDPRTAWPALVVEDMGESQSPATWPGGTDRRLERQLMLLVTAELQQVAGYAAARDTLLADVEAIAAGTLLPGVKSIVPVNYEPSLSHMGERPIVVGRQFFQVLYVTTQGNPSLTL